MVHISFKCNKPLGENKLENRNFFNLEGSKFKYRNFINQGGGLKLTIEIVIVPYTIHKYINIGKK